MRALASAPPNLLGRGLYTFREAARLTGLKHTRVREWFRCRPLVHSDIAPVGHDFAMSFHDLIDVFVAGSLRDSGISMQAVRRVHERMQSDLGVLHPFCHQEFLADGKRIFVKYGDDRLVDVLRHQGVFEQIIRPFLKKMDYDALTLLAQLWRIGSGIVIDPQICFGAPVVESVSIPTAILAASLGANKGDTELIANWYGVKKADILAASQFERRLAA